VVVVVYFGRLPVGKMYGRMPPVFPPKRKPNTRLISASFPIICFVLSVLSIDNLVAYINTMLHTLVCNVYVCVYLHLLVGRAADRWRKSLNYEIRWGFPPGNSVAFTVFSGFKKTCRRTETVVNIILAEFIWLEERKVAGQSYV
jgi:hypothetical protein